MRVCVCACVRVCVCQIVYLYKYTNCVHAYIYIYIYILVLQLSIYILRSDIVFIAPVLICIVIMIQCICPFKCTFKKKWIYTFAKTNFPLVTIKCISIK